jgi:hypothetical protein
MNVTLDLSISLKSGGVKKILADNRNYAFKCLNILYIFFLLFLFMGPFIKRFFSLRQDKHIQHSTGIYPKGGIGLWLCATVD